MLGFRWENASRTRHSIFLLLIGLGRRLRLRGLRLREFLQLGDLALHDGDVGRILGEEAQIPLHLLHGSVDIVFLGEDDAENLAHLGNALLRIGFHSLTRALLGGVQIVEVEVGDGVEEIRLREVERIELEAFWLDSAQFFQSFSRAER